MINKFSDRATHGKIADFKRDIFSDGRDALLGSIGLDKDARDYVQPVLDKAKSLLPPSGEVPRSSAGAGADSLPQSTGFSFQSDTNPHFVMIGLLIVAGAIYLAVRK